MLKKYFNPYFSRKQHFFSTLFGLGMVLLAYQQVNIFIEHFSSELDLFIPKYIMVGMLLFLGLTGVVMLTLNFNLKVKSVQIVLSIIIICLIALGLIIINDSFFLLVSLTSFFLAVIFLVYLYSPIATLVTMIILSGLYILATQTIHHFLGINFNLYIALTLFLLLNSYVGVIISRIMIKGLKGEEEARKFEREVVITHLNVIYIAIFISINLKGINVNEELTILGTTILNSFVTAIAINQIKLEHLVDLSCLFHRNHNSLNK
ncbi:hypothetical protein [Anaerobranca gottschalkii]|uniref:Uncharacterized protein n=1 Tax=Anaerobranca gottschalkii DSM 13577 TaxID=1120990 RepID=A0A1I0A430_9FIRM|nr:hypothetical protein [Anaerobranca gottschalkii]SES88443.1 hypothetical protein SAMN03080614_101640 [Anaerobranca gottschalkii DSM 13577]